MVDLREHADFPPEPLHAIVIVLDAGRPGVQDLESPIDAGRQVVNAIDLSHAAAAKQRVDAVALGVGLADHAQESYSLDGRKLFPFLPKAGE